MAKRTMKKGPKQVETLTHDAATRRNIPTAELQSTAERMEEQNRFKPVVYERATPLAMGETRLGGSGSARRSYILNRKALACARLSLTDCGFLSFPSIIFSSSER